MPEELWQLFYGNGILTIFLSVVVFLFLLWITWRMLWENGWQGMWEGSKDQKKEAAKRVEAMRKKYGCPLLLHYDKWLANKEATIREEEAIRRIRGK